MIHGPNIPDSYAILFFTASDTLLSPPATSTTGHHLHFGSASSFFLELFLHFFPVAYWTPTNQAHCSSGVISFHLFILFMGVSRQEYYKFLDVTTTFIPQHASFYSIFSTIAFITWFVMVNIFPLPQKKCKIHGSKYFVYFVHYSILEWCLEHCRCSVFFFIER